MFDMGFIRDVRRIVASVSKQRQTLLFSATMPGDISKLASEILKNPEKVEIAPQGRTVDKVDQRVYFVNAASQACAAEPPAERRDARARHRLHPHQARRQSRRRGAGGSRRALRGDPRQQVAERPPEGARQFQPRPGPRAGRHRSRLARHRRHGRHPRHQLRAAGRRRELRPSHRPHRARRRLGHRPVVLRRQRARPAQEHRAADQPAHRRRPDAGQRGHAGGAAAASQGRARRARRRRASRASRQRSRSQATPMATATVVAAAAAIARSASARAAIARRRPRPSISGRAATIAKPRRAIAPTTIVRAPARRRANAPTAPARTPTGPTRRARKATARSAARRAAAVASAVAVGRAAVVAAAAVAAGRLRSRAQRIPSSRKISRHLRSACS